MKYMCTVRVVDVKVWVIWNNPSSNYASPVVVSLPGCSVGGIGVGVVAVSA